MRTRTLTAAQYDRALQAARRKHDAQYEVDNPRPSQEAYSDELTLLERAAGHLWVIWTVLALAGALISLPHTLRTVLSTVDLPGWQAWAYSIAVFIGVELALIGVALASELKRSEEQEEQPPRAASLAGGINWLAMRVGVAAPFDTSHLPERRPAGGGLLVSLLFAASLTFNLADTLADVTLLQPYAAEIHLASRIMAGVLGPGLLLIAGHRFAVEVVKAAAGRKDREAQYRAALQAWQDGLQASWQAHGEAWVNRALAAAWRARNPGVPDEHNPYLDDLGDADPGPFAGQPVKASTTGNGHKRRVGA